MPNPETQSNPSMDTLMNNLVDSMDSKRHQEDLKNSPLHNKGSYRSLISKWDRLNVLGDLGGLGLRSDLRKVDLSEAHSSPVIGGQPDNQDLLTSRDDQALKDVLNMSKVMPI